MQFESPVTLSQNIKPIVSYKSGIMSDSRLIDEQVDNYICLDTGLVFNASGPRGSEKGFYTDVYDLHSESNVSEFKYFEEKKSVGIYDDIQKFISKNVSLDENGSILDIGCGKGILLAKLWDKHRNSSFFWS